MNTLGCVILLLVVALAKGSAVASDRDVAPRTLPEYVNAGTAYVHAAVPAERPLTWDQLERWIVLLDATDAQADVIRSKYVEYITDPHNSLLSAALPAYLVQSATAAADLRAHGIGSDQFASSWGTARSTGLRLIASIERLEVEFIDSLAPLLDERQSESLAVLRWHATRRACRSVSTNDRWIGLELRELFDQSGLEPLSAADQASIRSHLFEHERELTPLMRQWYSANLEAGEKVRRRLRSDATGVDGPGAQHPANAWDRPASITRRIGLLHRNRLEFMFQSVSPELAARVRTAAEARIYPEVHPDRSASLVVDVLTGLASDRNIAEPQRAIAAALLASHRESHARLSRRLEDACIEWDDQVARGNVEYVGDDLGSSLKPLLDEREELSRDSLRRALEEFGSDAVDRHRPGASRRGGASGSPSASQSADSGRP